MGYERRTFISGDLVTYQAPFERVDHLGIEHALDIHWRIANPQVVSQVLTHDELVERSVTVRVQGHPMRVPSAVDALLVACVHRVAHHPDFEKPIWVRDIHVLATGLERVRVADLRRTGDEPIGSAPSAWRVCSGPRSGFRPRFRWRC